MSKSSLPGKITTVFKLHFFFNCFCCSFCFSPHPTPTLLTCTTLKKLVKILKGEKNRNKNNQIIKINKLSLTYKSTGAGMEICLLSIDGSRW